IPGGAVFDVTSDVFYWFYTGLLLLTVRLDREIARTAAAQRAAQAAPPAPVTRMPEPATTPA
ncbi:MAG TPA: hypothetical protein VJ725_00220, partial [Thermoanaerobaculia bacterium]|nr:hypothetical protein [Thermoanaerobaculia bacterium]